MRVVLQRVFESSVEVEGKIVGSIGNGFNVLLGVGKGDTEKDADYLIDKILGLRIFRDENGKINLSIADRCALGDEMGILLISQFTLYADARKGKRPSFDNAAAPADAEKLYEYFRDTLKAKCEAGNIKFGCGIFGADMTVKIINNGPFTVLFDSGKAF